MKLTELLKVLPFYKTTHSLDTLTVNQIQMNDEDVKHGDIFICICGLTFDGHDFAQNAVKNGAVAIITEKKLNIDSIPIIQVSDTIKALALLAHKYYDYPTKKFPLIGITGTNGKTTITYLLNSIFNAAQLKSGLIGTIQAQIDDYIIPVKHTTPDTLALQQIFHQMALRKADVVTIEVSSHALDLGRVYGCDFDIAVFTNLSHDHLDYHNNMHDYFHAKSLLFSRLGNDYEETKKYAVMNSDDPYFVRMKQSTSHHVISYGLTESSEVKAVNIEFQLSGMTFTIITPLGKMNITTHLLGQFNVYNILAAVTVSLLLDLPLATIQQGIEQIKGIPGRFERVSIGQNYSVIVDYAHTPDSLENVLKTIQEFVKGRIYVVVGTGGDRDRTKRPLMANVATKYAHLAIFTTDNPRTEDPHDILNDMTYTLDNENYEIVIDRKDAIIRAIELAHEGDVVLIAGKGHETYQEIHGVTYDFDDRLIARQAIEEKKEQK